MLSGAMMAETRGFGNTPPNRQFFGNAGRGHMGKCGSTLENYAEIAWVNHEHSQRNPYAQFRDAYTLEDILKSPKMFKPLTKLQCCPVSTFLCHPLHAVNDIDALY
jgi:sterol carrier protein 2